MTLRDRLTQARDSARPTVAQAWQENIRARFEADPREVAEDRAALDEVYRQLGLAS